MTSVSQFAAPRDGEASFWSACGTTPLDFQEPMKSCDSFAAADPGGGEAPLCLRIKSFRWASEESTKLLTVSQFAVPRDSEDSF